jgi:DNA-directed RNA polymerase specialized sigma24 family protein
VNEKYQAARAEANDLFQAFLHCPAEEEDQLLSKLISVYTEPLIDQIVRFKLQGTNRFHSDVDDLRHDILVQLLEHLRRLRFDPNANQIQSFRDYVAVIAYNACNNYFRKRNPQREALKNKLRYILRHDPDLAIWNEADEWLCGEAKWKSQKASCPREELFAQIQIKTTGTDEHQLLKRIFTEVGMPVKLDDLIEGLSSPSGEPQFVPFEILKGPADENLLLDPPVLSRMYLQEAWTEICQLPVKQRIALLLNLRDVSGNGILVAFPAIGIASARKIAEVLQMSAEELAVLWKDLPLDDNRISEILGVTRQQVINLRKCSRERLNRRLLER